jgi:hypothetical protein
MCAGSGTAPAQTASNLGFGSMHALVASRSAA